MSETCSTTRRGVRCRLAYGHGGRCDAGSGPWPDTWVDEVYEARCLTCGLISTHLMWDDAKAAIEAHDCPAASP